MFVAELKVDPGRCKTTPPRVVQPLNVPLETLLVHMALSAPTTKMLTREPVAGFTDGPEWRTPP